ncbi:hypothetical protein V1278_003203 [Bradyrhizobium sp. AZCC 1577]
MTFMPSTSGFARATKLSDADPCGPMDRNGDHWTEDQILILACFVRDEGLSNSAVALRMGRTEGSIITAVSRYCVRDPRAKLRPCLGDACHGKRCSLA